MSLNVLSFFFFFFFFGTFTSVRVKFSFKFLSIFPLLWKLIHSKIHCLSHYQRHSVKSNRYCCTVPINLQRRYLVCHISVPLPLLTYLLTPWCRVLLEQLTGFAVSQEIPHISPNPKAHYRTHKRPPPVSILASPIQSIYPHPTSWRFILILSTHLRLGLPSGLFPSGFPTRPYTPPLLAHTRHMPSPSHSSRFYHPRNIGWGVQII